VTVHFDNRIINTVFVYLSIYWHKYHLAQPILWMRRHLVRVCRLYKVTPWLVDAAAHTVSCRQRQLQQYATHILVVCSDLYSQFCLAPWRTHSLHCHSFLPLVALGVNVAQLELNWIFTNRERQIRAETCNACWSERLLSSSICCWRRSSSERSYTHHVTNSHTSETSRDMC